MKFYNFIIQIIKQIDKPIVPFILIVLGTLGQSLHTYYLVRIISPFSEPLVTISAIILSVFLACGLLFFSVKKGLVGTITINEKEVKDVVKEDKYETAVTVFQVFETFINLFFWVKKICYIGEGKFDFTEWYLLVAAIPLAICLPAFLRYYAGEITHIYLDITEQTAKTKIEALEQKVQILENIISGELTITLRNEGDKTDFTYNKSKIIINDNK